MKYISILKENPARENGYEIIGRRSMVKQDVIDYFKSIRPTRKEREQGIKRCERCGALHPKYNFKDWELCKYCYYTKVNMPNDVNTPDIEDLERLGLDKKRVFAYTKDYKNIFK